MFKTLLSKVGWGELPSSFGYTIGEKVELPFSWNWELHKGQKKSDGSSASVFMCAKKDLDPAQAMAAKNAEQVSKTLRHPNILRAFNSIETEGGVYIVTEEVVPLVTAAAAEGDDDGPAIWGLFQALDGLSFLHSSGFTHGLFGPLAIWVTNQGDYRIGSFELCQKGLDTGSAIAARRRVGPNSSGLPEPPSAMQNGGMPSVGIDMWGAAVLMAFVFASPRARMQLDLRQVEKEIPLDLRKAFMELENPKPLRGRSPLADIMALGFFQQHPAVQVFSFLSNLQLKSPEEKEAFFEGLPQLLEGLSEGVKKRQVLPELLTAQRFPGQEAAHLLPSILKIGVKLTEEQFREKVAPLVAQLFAAPDRTIRFRLLTSLGDMIEFLDDAMINDKIFPECVNGFTDSNGPIREASMIFFVPRLKPKTVESRVLKLLVKMMQDPEASIRTNALICVGRVSGGLPAASVNQTLLTVIGAGLKDPFSPCRCAALQTLIATANNFTAEELAQKLLPGVCSRFVDPDQAVSDVAFTTLPKVQEVVRQKVAERRAAATAKEAGAEPTSTKAEETSSWAQGGSFYNQISALSMDKVRQKFMGSVAGSMNQPGQPAAPAGVQEAPPAPAASCFTLTGAPVQPRAPAQLGGGGSKMTSSSGSTKFGKQPSGGAQLDLDLDDEPAGGGWGDEDIFGDSHPSQAAKADDFGDDFFDEFDAPDLQQT
ncbi:unnamed protein product [Effrenium voratum]|uniref:Protein kinase domain-containing protein n=1 Tax=Effrenium voratum TaxID=2562239 RepID=A0AA36JKW0_9DINO|nr:unnamed protein product [Effrenium voratum]